MSLLVTPFTAHAHVEVPVICGAMYPCSNPELVAAVSEAGGLGIMQPVSMVFAHGYDLQEGIRLVRRLTQKPVGFNAIVEQSSRALVDQMRRWIDVALQEGVRFFVTALGNPRWVVEMVHGVGGVVYHDVTERKWGQRARDAGVDGFICVNNRAGGHTGTRTARGLLEELRDLGVPLVCAGGAGDGPSVRRMLEMGYAGVQLGTRFIATTECTSHDDYKRAIIRAKAADIVLTDKISGVPVSVINTPYIEKVGTRAHPLMRVLLRNARTKHYARMYYTLKSTWQLKRASLQGMSYKDYYLAGQSVDFVDRVEPAGEIVRRMAEALQEGTPRGNGTSLAR
jgi:nitronate monooxygenase